jgi:phosphonate transport system substrate-binding protein
MRPDTIARITLFRLLTVLCLASLLAFPARSEESYTFAVVPQFEQRKLFATWKPIVDELSRRTGIKLNLVATLTVPEFERELSRGSYDFVYANPYHILREFTRQGYMPLVRDQSPLRGILVVRKDSPLKSPAELNGEKLAIPSYNALGASLLLQADLAQVFKATPKLVNVKTHSSVYLQVASGQLAAGGGVEKTLQEQDKTVQDMLRVLYTTREMPSHPVAVHPRVPVKVRQAVQQALLAMSQSEEGQKMLLHVPMQKAISTSMQDYLPMRQWGLDTYWVD